MDGVIGVVLKQEGVEVMPLFDFKCNVCSEVVEIRENIPPACPTCSETMQRVWSPVGVKFNASGFYSTDNPKR